MCSPGFWQPPGIVLIYSRPLTGMTRFPVMFVCICQFFGASGCAPCAAPSGLYPGGCVFTRGRACGCSAYMHRSFPAVFPPAIPGGITSLSLSWLHYSCQMCCFLYIILTNLRIPMNKWKTKVNKLLPAKQKAAPPHNRGSAACQLT